MTRPGAEAPGLILCIYDRPGKPYAKLKPGTLYQNQGFFQPGRQFPQAVISKETFYISPSS